MIKMMPEDSIISLSAGGRNWLAMSTFAILLGVDTIRVGMEDHVHMYPHKTEKIRRSADEVRKIATIARELGREIATPAEARTRMGIRPA
jgi:uncharacterized protein (DUF849 family)